MRPNSPTSSLTCLRQLPRRALASRVVPAPAGSHWWILRGSTHSCARSTPQSWRLVVRRPELTMRSTDADKSRLLLETIGWPIGSGSRVPKPAEIETLTEFAFKSRVGLLFLEECLRKGVELGPAARELHESLTARRHATDEVIVRLASRLDEVAK